MLIKPTFEGAAAIDGTPVSDYSQFRWLVLATVFVTSISASMIMISFAPLMGVIAKDLGISLGAASFGFMGLHSLATAVGCAISGVIIDRLGVFRVLIASVVVMIVSNASLAWFGHSYGPVLAIRIVEAFGCAPVVVAIGPVVAKWFPPHEIGIANGAQSVSISLGIMLGLVAAPALFRAFGSWQVGVAWLSSGIVVILLVAIAVAAASKGRQPSSSASNETLHSNSDLYRQALRKPYFWAGALCIAGGVWTQQAFNDLTPGYLAVAPPVGIGFGPLLAGKLMTTVMIAGIVGSMLGGTLIDRVFRGKGRPVILLGYTLIAIFCALIMSRAVYGQRPLLVMCLILVGIGTPFINPSTLGFAASSFPPSIVGRVVGLWMSIALFSGATGVMVGATALRMTGNYHLSIIVVSSVALLGIGAAMFLRRPVTKHG